FVCRVERHAELSVLDGEPQLGLYADLRVDPDEDFDAVAGPGRCPSEVQEPVVARDDDLADAEAEDLLVFCRRLRYARVDDALRSPPAFQQEVELIARGDIEHDPL